MLPRTSPRRVQAGAPQTGRMDVSETASISVGIAMRYATAVFELARDGGTLDALERDIDALDAILTDSDDFRDLVMSPVYSRGDQGRAVFAVAERMELSENAANLLGLMASRRRLFLLPHLFRALRALISEERGEVTAEVTASCALTDGQRERLARTLKASVGKDVKMIITVDEGLVGGIVVKVGSKMIDTSVASRLAKLQNAMKEVG